MSWPEVEHACRGYELRQTRDWERTRTSGEWLASFLGVDLKKELAKKGRKRLLDLPTDTVDTSAPAETNEEFLARMAAANYFRTPKARA